MKFCRCALTSNGKSDIFLDGVDNTIREDIECFDEEEVLCNANQARKYKRCEVREALAAAHKEGIGARKKFPCSGKRKTSLRASDAETTV